MLDLETAEICAKTGTSTHYCTVMLHRTRTGLQDCLEEARDGTRPNTVKGG